jgi:N6-L-threonylcarbamoyladenine synthase
LLYKTKSSRIEFQFSGLKQPFSILFKKKIENPNFVDENLNDICASIQHTIIEILMDKLKLAVQETGITQIAIMGSFGKFWNSKHLKRNRKKYGWKTFIPKFEYTTDNAAMIGIVGYQKFIQQFETSSVVSKARIQI